jgi:hypothetical protein
MTLTMYDVSYVGRQLLFTAEQLLAAMAPAVAVVANKLDNS